MKVQMSRSRLKIKKDNLNEEKWRESCMLIRTIAMVALHVTIFQKFSEWMKTTALKCTTLLVHLKMRFRKRSMPAQMAASIGKTEPWGKKSCFGDFWAENSTSLSKVFTHELASFQKNNYFSQPEIIASVALRKDFTPPLTRAAICTPTRKEK